MKDITNIRQNKHKVHPLIINRWSPRSMSGEEITEQELMTLLDAAHWAPSSYNNQPWRFLYAKRNTPHFKTFLDLMIEFNQSWCINAAVLFVVISGKNFEHNNKPAHTHSYDTGAAWENLALQATAMGLVAHGMEGFDYDKAKKVLKIPDTYQVEAMAAVGKHAPKEKLPPELQKREEPSQRKQISEIAFEGSFRG